MPDVVCLLELKSTSFPEKEISRAGYGAVWQSQKSWNGVAILARGREPIETCRGLPTGPDDQQSRYIEAAVDGILAGCVYLPNGNPAPEPRFDYKRHWFLRLKAYAAAVLELEILAILAGDFTVMPTYWMSTSQKDGSTMPFFGRTSAKPILTCSNKDGRTPFVTFIQLSASTRSGNIGGTALNAMPDCVLIISSCRLP